MAFQWGAPVANAYGNGAPAQYQAQTNPQYGSSMYYQPGSTYGADQSYNTSPVSGTIREQNPQLAYTQYGQQIGIGDQDSPFNNWFFQQYPRFQRAYGQATLQNPFITIDDFLKTLPSLQQVQRQYMMQAPRQRGLDYSSLRAYSQVDRAVT